jgi:hypothetical protein
LKSTIALGATWYVLARPRGVSPCCAVTTTPSTGGIMTFIPLLTSLDMFFSDE